jgi:hypothetical protein
VTLTELHEGLVGSPLQSVIEVVTLSRDKPNRHGWIGGVSRNVHMDLVAPELELMVQAAMVHGKSRVAKTVQHIPEQGGKPGAVQPIATEPSIGFKGGTGVVIHRGSHPSFKNKGEMNQHFINRTETTNQNSKINHNDSKTLTQIPF